MTNLGVPGPWPVMGQDSEQCDLLQRAGFHGHTWPVDTLGLQLCVLRFQRGLFILLNGTHWGDLNTAEQIWEVRQPLPWPPPRSAGHQVSHTSGVWVHPRP